VPTFFLPKCILVGNSVLDSAAYRRQRATIGILLGDGRHLRGGHGRWCLFRRRLRFRLSFGLSVSSATTSAAPPPPRNVASPSLSLLAVCRLLLDVFLALAVVQRWLDDAVPPGDGSGCEYRFQMYE